MQLIYLLVDESNNKEASSWLEDRIISRDEAKMAQECLFCVHSEEGSPPNLELNSIVLVLGFVVLSYLKCKRWQIGGIGRNSIAEFDAQLFIIFFFSGIHI